MQQTAQIYKKNENFVFRQIDDETILVPIKDNLGDMGAIYRLNAVGAFVWKHLDGKASFADIKNMMLDAFEVSEREADADLSDFLNQLKEIDAVIDIENDGVMEN
jgi:methyltransferase-like protein